MFDCLVGLALKGLNLYLPFTDQTLTLRVTLQILLLIFSEFQRISFSFISLWTPTFQKAFFIYLNDSPSKMIKNAFYFILKAFSQGI